MSFNPNKRRYEDDTVDKKKKLTREDFKQDIADAVKKGITKPPKKKASRGRKATGAYGNMKVAELRAFLNDKKKRLLTKSGFPNGALPRSKAAMIQLCKALKRKRW
jgi:hypothetical protein